MKKKGLLIAMLFSLVMILAACGESAQEKFIAAFDSDNELPDQNTQKVTLKMDELSFNGMEASEQTTANMLKDMSFSAQISTDKKAERSEAKLSLDSNGLVQFTAGLDVLTNDKTGEAYIALKDLVEPDDNLKTLLDQATNGAYSEVIAEHPDLKDKYLSSSELASLTGAEQEPVSDSVLKASEDLRKQMLAMMKDYFGKFEEDRFKEDDNGVISVTLNKADAVSFIGELEKFFAKDSVKKEMKTILESQGAVTDFNTEYQNIIDGLKEANKALKENKSTDAKIKVELTPDKDKGFKKVTIKTNFSDKKDSSQKVGFTMRVENLDYQKVADLPKADQIVSNDEFQQIVQEIVIKMIYGDDFDTSNYDFSENGL
ncbi:hypothetical protein [Listeria ilorinensis]|uniref:Lmo2079 family surface lipoprotein n=1 Tax=Listeria ilorinensis TaxID=2867439 RepID=UPI001EF50FE7|nr:hypothetical protein [Listeria ilorinensis]